MKKKKKWIWISCIAIICVALGIATTVSILNDENKITVEEKQWISDNTSVVQNVNVINNLNIYGKDGEGVFFDFIHDFGKNYNLTMNPITYNKEESKEGVSLAVTKEKKDDALLFFADHYVVVAKKKETIPSIASFTGKRIGVEQDDLEYAETYLKDIEGLELKPYVSAMLLEQILDNGEEIDYMLVPENEYLDSILSENYEIVYHFSDMKEYYYLETSDTTLGSVMRKYFIKWKKDEMEDSVQKATLSLYLDALKITQKELNDLTAKEIRYGFQNNSPYEVLVSGNYGGIISTYLKEFSDFSNVEFRFTKYKNSKKFQEALKDEKIDLFFAYYNTPTDYKTLSSNIPIKYVILAKNSDPTIINSLRSLKDQTVYVEENTILSDLLHGYDFLKVETYAKEKEQKKLLQKGEILAVDEKVYVYYANTIYKDYQVRYTDTLYTTYQFKIKGSETLERLFGKFVETLDPAELTIKGLQNHAQTVKSGNILSNIAKYFLMALALFGVTIIVIYRSKGRVKIAKKLKKEDKIRYIDELTSLKNRNYLTENIENWNKNTIYPQAVVVIDLNNLQEINDTKGYEQGDVQIKAAANVLIKTQLDNSDLMRTDGNEFLVYLVGYQERQIASYMHKLHKEFKNLPYEYGAAIGYSMITDDIKSIEDAMNEAVEDMKVKKEEITEE